MTDKRFIVKIDEAILGEFDTVFKANEFAKAISSLYIGITVVDRLWEMAWAYDAESSTWF